MAQFGKTRGKNIPRGVWRKFSKGRSAAWVGVPDLVMDASLSTLKKCRHLRLSSNSIDKISSLSGILGLVSKSLIAAAIHWGKSGGCLEDHRPSS